MAVIAQSHRPPLPAPTGAAASLPLRKLSFPALGTTCEVQYAAPGGDAQAATFERAAVAFWKRMAPPVATLHDGTQALVKRSVVPTMPTSYLPGRDGRVRFIHEGFHGDATDKALRRESETLLAEKN